jgi:putative transposase
MVNPKRVYRLNCEQGLNLRRKPKRKRAGGHLRLVRRQPLQINEYWSIDFTADALFNGRRFRVLSVVDFFSRECLGIEVDQGIRGQDVVELLDRIEAPRGIPGSLRCDNGLEFVSKALDLWAYENRVALDFSRPGKPTDNTFAESFIGSLRDECLNVN